MRRKMKRNRDRERARGTENLSRISRVEPARGGMKTSLGQDVPALLFEAQGCKDVSCNRRSCMSALDMFRDHLTFLYTSSEIYLIDDDVKLCIAHRSVRSLSNFLISCNCTI